MSAMKKPSLFLTTLGVALLCLGLGRARAEFEFQPDLEPDEEIQRLTVRITVGAEGEDLAEPVALDLGLGFPLWLHPLGRPEQQPASFGAVPQFATATETATAGSVAEFTFDVSGEAGQDVLQMSSQLLAGVRLADISRIGFMSRGDSKWVLAAYEIEINGYPFAANDEVNAAVDDRQIQIYSRLAELATEMSPLETEADELRTLVETDLATDEQAARWEEIDAELQPLAQERDCLERQLDGSYPWYEEWEFDSPWRIDESVRQVRVMLVTASHPGADTQNYVYYRAGGHKYLLSSPLNPLAAEDGLRVIPLDIPGGPLTAADLRGHALGMVAHEQPYDEAPDRWHPERLLVEVDGSVVYDSDENELDRLSLEAIRIIPPAHFDEAAAVVANEPLERETYLWEAGNGQGLDLAGGGALPLPDVDDPTFPQPEPGLTFDAELYASAEDYDGLDGFQPFPGEGEWYDDPWDDGSGYWDDGGYYDDEGYWDDGGYYDGGGYWDGGGYYDGGGVSWDQMLGIPWAELLGLLQQLLDDATGDAAGDPVQVENVQLVPLGGGWEVQWDVSGDDSEVTEYLVELLVLDPATGTRTAGILPDYSAHFADRQYPIPQADIDAAAATVGNPLLLYLEPHVVAVAADGSEHRQPGAARALSELTYQFNPIQPYSDFTGFFRYYTNLGPGVITSSPPSHGTAAWTEDVCQCQGMLFDKPLNGCHLVFRVDPADTVGLDYSYAYFMNSGNLPAKRLVGHVGFLDHSGGAPTNSVDVRARCWDSSLSWTGAYQTLDNSLWPLAIDEPVDATTAGDIYVEARVQEIAGTSVPEPVVFLGMRFVDP
jgi:hypothetical protein